MTVRFTKIGKLTYDVNAGPDFQGGMLMKRNDGLWHLFLRMQWVPIAGTLRDAQKELRNLYAVGWGAS